MSVHLHRQAGKPRPAEPPLQPAPELRSRPWWRRNLPLIVVGFFVVFAAEIAALGYLLRVW